MHKLTAAFKLEFDTVRDLERKGYRVFAVSGGILGVGVVLTLTAIGMVVGIPLIVLGGAGFLGAMLWMAVQGKEPTRRVFCPYCATSNEVFRSRSEFACDICDRRVAVSPDGEVYALEQDPGQDD